MVPPQLQIEKLVPPLSKITPDMTKNDYKFKKRAILVMHPVNRKSFNYTNNNVAVEA